MTVGGGLVVLKLRGGSGERDDDGWGDGVMGEGLRDWGTVCESELLSLPYFL